MRLNPWSLLQDARAIAANAIKHAAERSAAAYEAGEVLAQQRQRNKDLHADLVAYKRAVAILAARLGEAKAHLDHLEGDTVAEAALTPLTVGFGQTNAVYEHKLDAHRITLVERTGAADWSYRSPGGQIWHIFDEDLHDQYRLVGVPADAPVPAGGGS